MGILTDDFRNPLLYVNTLQSNFIYDIVTKSDTKMVMRQRETSRHTLNNTIGCIVSSDRSIIYWVNNLVSLA